jgi:hypothetical protein
MTPDWYDPDYVASQIESLRRDLNQSDPEGLQEAERSSRLGPEPGEDVTEFAADIAENEPLIAQQYLGLLQGLSVDPKQRANPSGSKTTALLVLAGATAFKYITS